MNYFVSRLFLMMLLIASGSLLGFGQGGGSTSSITGVVVDASGGVIAGADVMVKNTSTSAEFKTITSDNGTFSVPALSGGTYSATITMPNFKVAVVRDIKLEVGVPATIRVILQVGGTTETVVVEAGAEMVQSQSASIATTINTSQIIALPTGSRSALEAIMSLPGINVSGTNSREARVVGLPEDMVNITIDGISSQDNYMKTTDGMFSRVRPGIDAMEQVTVSTATPGAESAGSGAVQIKFVTRSGNNEYHGSLYEYLTNPIFNANSWFNNRNIKAPAGENPLTWKSPPSQTKTNQFGGRIGGPIRIPKLFDGRDRAFFFFNYEELRQPGSVTQNQTIFSPQAELGNYIYTVGGVTNSVNLFNLAAANGQVSTWDPTVQKLLADIRNSTKQGTINLNNDPLYQTLAFTLPMQSKWRYVTSRFDFNISSKHRLEFTQNHNKLFALPYDTTNGYQPAFPGFPNWGVQGSNRFNGSLALRSTLTPRLVNELRGGVSGGSSLFNPNLNLGMFSGPVANMDGWVLNIGGPGIDNPYVMSTGSRRNAPTKVIEDTLSWSKGTHSLSFGVNWSKFSVWLLSQRTIPTISLGVDTNLDPARTMFDGSNKNNFPGNPSTSQLGVARSMYGTLTGRVTQISGTAYLGEKTNQYEFLGNTTTRGHYQELGSFIQDAWRVRSNLTLTYGVRWQLALPFVSENNTLSTATIADAWGVSGVGNLYKPGTLTGKVPEFIQYKAGVDSYATQYKDFAPSFGFAWSPGAKDGWLGKIIGDSGKTVVRGGYSLSYSRMGMATYTGMYTGNPGGSLTAARNVNRGNLVSGVGTDVWPLLFRDRSRLTTGTFPKDPTYPLLPASSTNINGYSDTASMTVFDPNLKMPYAQSWSFGIQREIEKSTALEIRYVGTRSLQGWTTYDYNSNEYNLAVNGVFEEFKLAMANLAANIKNGKSSSGFKYLGPGTGTNPLPITLGFLSGYAPSLASDQTKYTSSNFTNTAFTNSLNVLNANPQTYASNLRANATYRANGLAAGYPANFFYTNPNLTGGISVQSNGGYTRYDSLVIELRRRMAKGLMVQANYVWAKNFASSRISFSRARYNDLGSTVPHTFKVNWIYELPVGRGRTFASNVNGFLDRIIGGWDMYGIARIQSGDLQDFGNVNLVGMTDKDLRSLVQLRFDDAKGIIYYLPDDIIQNNILAASFSATSATGYSGNAPTGRYIQGARVGCVAIFSEDCAPRHHYVRDLPFTEFEMSLVKQVRFTENKNFELRAEFMNAFNAVNFGLTTSTTLPCSGTSLTQCQTSVARSGARRVQIVMRLNF